MGSEWIKRFKDNVAFQTVALALGMTNSGGRARWRPCKACNQDRTGSDARGCVGTNAAGAWKCHACNAKGDVVTLLCYAVTGTDSPSNEGWEQVRQAAVKQGWVKDEGAHVSGRVRPMGAALKPTVQSKPAAPPTSPDETPDERSVNTRGLFRWSEDLPERCALVYVNPGTACSDWSAAHKQIAVEVVRYMTEYRKISDDVLIDAKIGIYVDESGQPILSEGRPWITIPLPDKAGRFVNVHFRRVPIPGTCAACDALGPWKECDPCRKGKRYRLCPGRPTPLYGADRLTPGKGAVARVIEGELDVLALRTYGMGENTVSGTSGASNFAEDWLDSLEPFDSIYLCYDDDEAGKKGAADLAAKLGTYKCSKVTFPKKDAGDCLIAGVPAETMARAFKVADSYLDVKLRRADEFRERVKEQLTNTEQRRGVSTTSEVMDSAIGGWSNGLVVITGETGNGKSLILDEPVLTPTGWRPIGTIRVGDEVVAVDGGSTIVTGVFPQGVRKICRVTFNDGVVVRCDWDHLWAVASDLDLWKGNDWRVLTTRQIADTVNASGRKRWRVPLVSAVQHPVADLPIDPYILGVLIGDGSLTTAGVRFDNADEPLIDEVTRRLPAGLRLISTSTRSRARKCTISVDAIGRTLNPMSAAITTLGLRQRAENKFIPASYFIASVEQRLDLLRGLLDTDGFVSRAGEVQFYSSSERLAGDVGNLVRSLGGSVRIVSKIPSYVYKGEKREGLRHYQVTIALPVEFERSAFLIPRKADRLKPRKVPPQRKIVSIEEAGEAECVCIAVDHPSHLYVTTGYTVTHNTTWATWQLWALAKSGQCVAVTSFEQQPVETVIQLLHMELGGMPDEFKEADWDAALDRLAELPILIVDHYGHLPYAKLEEALKYAVRRCGARYILIDHLGFLVDPEAEDERRAIQSVVRSMVLVRKDMDVTIFLIVHPRNDPDASKKFGRVTMQHLKGASAIRQDADMVLIVTRELPNTEKGRMLSKGKRRPWPQTRIYIDKKRGRYGNVSGAGEVVMAFDPKALVFADTWDQTPMGRAGVLIDTTPSEVRDEGDDIEDSTNTKGGVKKAGKGRKTKTESGFDNY